MTEHGFAHEPVARTPNGNYRVHCRCSQPFDADKLGAAHDALFVHLIAINATDHALASHTWIIDEDTNGRRYRYCTRCRRDEDACLPNEFHGPVTCDPA